MNKKEILSHYKNYLEAHGLVENSINLYSSQIRIALQANAFESVKQLHKFINHRRKILAQSSFNSNLDAFRSFIRFSEISETITIKETVTKEIISLKGFSNPILVQDRRAYTNDEIKKIMNVEMEAWRWQFIWTGLNFGMRASEIRHLTFNDIDLSLKRIYVKAEFSKNKISRFIPIIDSNLSVLKTWMDLNDNQLYYLEARKGKILSKRSASFWSKQSKDSGVEIKSHNFRYTFATKLYQKTKDIVLVQKLLGHSNPEVTSIYLKLTQKDIEHEFRKIRFKVV